jgi:hypothetical protein
MLLSSASFCPRPSSRHLLVEVVLGVALTATSSSRSVTVREAVAPAVVLADRLEVSTAVKSQTHNQSVTAVGIHTRLEVVGASVDVGPWLVAAAMLVVIRMNHTKNPLLAVRALVRGDLHQTNFTLLAGNPLVASRFLHGERGDHDRWD